MAERPILAVDVDGVISLFGFDDPPDRELARFELIDGMVHCVSLAAGERLRRLADHFDLFWATGWEDRANDRLPGLLGIPELPAISFDGAARFGTAHWKLRAPRGLRGRAGRLPGSTTPSTTAATSGRRRARRGAPTLLVPTESAAGPGGGAGGGTDALGPGPAARVPPRIRGRLDFTRGGFLAHFLPGRSS